MSATAFEPEAGRLAPVCRVCARDAAAAFQVLDGRRYWRCRHCLATFLDAACLPSGEEERRHYAHHRNEVDDPAYRGFLARFAEPLVQRLPAGAEGLDYGCGPGPALAAMLREAGFSMSVYDPIYAPDAAMLAREYDFIVCTETAEHFHEPAKEFAKLRALLRPGGVLALMTCFQTDDALFAGWRYRLDPTHVVFYREETFRLLAEDWGWESDIPCKDVAFLYKPAAAT